MSVYEIVHATEDQRKTVLVPLSNSKRKVKLYETDYRALLGIGAGLPWKWMQGTVYIRNNGYLVSVARLILDVDKGQKVSYVDGDATNLIRPNLIRTAGSSKYKARDQIIPEHKPKLPDIRHIQH